MPSGNSSGTQTVLPFSRPKITHLWGERPAASVRISLTDCTSTWLSVILVRGDVMDSCTQARPFGTAV